VAGDGTAAEPGSTPHVRPHQVRRLVALSIVAASLCAFGAASARAIAGPQPVLTPDAVDFGSVQLGSVSSVVDVTLANSGGGPLSFWRFGIASSSANPSDFWVAPGGTCSTTTPLAAGESCTVRVRFNPTSIGNRAGLLSFWVNTPSGRINATLIGTAPDPCADGCL
jgi:HYDIN/CFA65/VesB-like, Ig-like domain